MDNNFLTARQVTEILGIGFYHLYRLIREGKISFYERVGKANRYRFHRDEIDRYKRQRRPVGRPPQAQEKKVVNE